MEPSNLSSSSTRTKGLAPFIRETALRLGFDHVAFAPARPVERAEFLKIWLGEGYHASMAWMEKGHQRRIDPRVYFPEARSVVCLLMNYASAEGAAEDPGRARISRYAWGEDYHEVVKRRLFLLADAIREAFPGVPTRVAVDTAPVLEKPMAQAAGLGWVGKNACLIRQTEGSWFFLGEVLVGAELPVGEAAVDRCGTCRRCLDACPTGAIVAPYVVDSNLCISYLTIEHRGAIDRGLRGKMGNRVFGCDDCQDVCPWNSFAGAAAGTAGREEFRPRPENLAPLLSDLIGLDEAGFRARFKGSVVKRAKRDGFLRNVAIAMGNSGDRGLVEPLVRALEDASALVRGHVAWALGRLGGEAAERALSGRLGVEEDAWVREEIEAALASVVSG